MLQIYIRPIMFFACLMSVVGFAEKPSFPRLYVKDKAWLKNSFSILVSELGAQPSSKNLSHVHETLEVVLLEKMLPYVYLKKLELKRVEAIYQSEFDAGAEKRSYASNKRLRYLSESIETYKSQLLFLVAELKKLGLSGILESVSDLESVMNQFPYERRSGGGFAIRSDGSLSLTKLPSSHVRAKMLLTLETKVNQRHQGDVNDFVETLVGRLKTYRFALNLIPALDDFAF